MAVDTSLNQFKQGKAVGDLDLNYFGGGTTITCRFNINAGSTTLKAGEAVKLTDLGSDDLAGVPIVAKRTADTDAIFGVVKRSLKQSSFEAGDMVEIAIEGSVMFLLAGAALNRGVKVSTTFGTSGTLVAAGTKAYLGYTLDKASAANDVIRVFIKADAVTAGTT